jgi:hypothetical protein
VLSSRSPTRNSAMGCAGASADGLHTRVAVGFRMPAPRVLPWHPAGGCSARGLSPILAALLLELLIVKGDGVGAESALSGTPSSRAGADMLEARIESPRGSLYYAAEGTRRDLEMLRLHVRDLTPRSARGDLRLEVTLDESDPAASMIASWLGQLAATGVQVKQRASGPVTLCSSRVRRESSAPPRVQGAEPDCVSGRAAAGPPISSIGMIRRACA